MLDQPDCKLVWFFGAGCSISSGIPGAATLVERWLPRLKSRETGTSDDWRDWAQARFGTYDPSNAGLLYGQVMDELFPLPYERQQEVERITSDRDPAIGYALFSVLAAHEEYGPKSNIVLTTNFDDLVADSLYLLTRKKPLVVAHESLAAFARASRNRPLVVKVHGDARLEPRNTIKETNELDGALASRLTTLLSGSALIFCGYAGNDKSISKLLAQVPVDSFPLGIYWVGREVPSGELGTWLKDRPEFFHVRHQDFDSLLVQIAERLNISLPGIDRLRDLFDEWTRALHRTEVSAKAQSEPDVGRAASRLRRDLDGLKEALQAARLEDSDPDAALAAYEEAVDRGGDQSAVYLLFANFLKRKKRDYERAEAMYDRAISLGSNDASALAGYAEFLTEIRKDHESAEALFERAITAEPNKGFYCVRYADFLVNSRRDSERALILFQRAVKIDPDDGYVLTKFAQFQADVGGDNSAARELFERALTTNSDKSFVLSTYAEFLVKVERDTQRADQYFEAAVDADPESSSLLGRYADFLDKELNDADRAEEMFERSLRAKSLRGSTLVRYAEFIGDTRKDASRAEEMFQRAVDIDPDDGFVLYRFAEFLSEAGSDLGLAEMFYKRATGLTVPSAFHIVGYAEFLVGRGDFAAAEAQFRKALDVDPSDAYCLSRYADFLARDQRDIEGAIELYKRSIATNDGSAYPIVKYADIAANYLNDFVLAVDLHERALKLEPNNVHPLMAYAAFLSTPAKKDLVYASELYQKAMELEPSEPLITLAYADFLASKAGDLERAREFLESLHTFVPDNVIVSGQYALFLAHYDKNFDAAIVLFKQILELDEPKSNTMGNYAQVLFAAELNDEANTYATALLDKDDIPPALRVEVLFYMAAHNPGDIEFGVLLRRLVDLGRRSPGWRFEINIDRLEREGDFRVDFFRRLASVISEDEEPAVLEPYTTWSDWRSEGV